MIHDDDDMDLIIFALYNTECNRECPLTDNCASTPDNGLSCWKLANKMTLDRDYYIEDVVLDMVNDREDLLEYLNGWDDAIVDDRYKKEYVDMFVRR